MCTDNSYSDAGKYQHCTDVTGVTLAVCAAIRGAYEGRLKKHEAVLYGLSSYVFCIDVIVSVIAYVIIRKRSKSD